MSKKDWFSAWFDSPYYHILYAKRDEQEAAEFIKKLQLKLAIKPHSTVLDAACGKGRHAKILHRLDLTVDGFDLSPANIKSAKSKSSPGLNFFVHDLRDALPKLGFYDAIFNFFTSFGYFDQKSDNQKAFDALSDGLKKGGVLVMDFLNPTYILDQLVESELVTRRGLDFHIKRWESHGYLYKSIEFSDLGENFHFEEKVELIHKNEFIQYASAAGLSLVDLCGDYQLNPFDNQNSPRMIFFWTKNEDHETL